MAEAQQAVNSQSNQFARNCSLGGIKAILGIQLPGDWEDVE